MKVDQIDMTKPIQYAKDDPDKIHNFPHDIFLAGPPDRRVSEPYRQMFKDAFPDLNIYDWETYTGADYQERNQQAMRDSFMFVGFVPNFPLPALGEEIGYFYCYHEYRIKYCRRGLQLNHRQIKFGDLAGPHSEAKIPEFVPEFSPPINPIVLIWPDELEPKFAQKTYLQVADIATCAEAAILLVKANLIWLKRWKRDFYPHIKTHYEFQQLEAVLNRNYELREKDPFFELPVDNQPAKIDSTKCDHCLIWFKESWPECPRCQKPTSPAFNPFNIRRPIFDGKQYQAYPFDADWMQSMIDK